MIKPPPPGQRPLAILSRTQARTVWFVLAAMLAVAVVAAIAGTQTIIASALALGAALMCSVFFFVSREPALLLLVIPCAAVLLHWFPSKSRWARIAPASAATTGPARRMMRE